MALTKKDKELLRSHKCDIIKPVDVPLHYIVQMSLTLGELLALKHALEENPTMVGEDVKCYLNNAIERAGVTF